MEDGNRVEKKQSRKYDKIKQCKDFHKVLKLAQYIGT